MSGFTFRERALIILSGLSDIGAGRILALGEDETTAILWGAERNPRDVSAIVMAPESFVALDAATIVKEPGIPRVCLTPHLSGLRAMAATAPGNPADGHLMHVG